jgi:hypothetical protein
MSDPYREPQAESDTPEALGPPVYEDGELTPRHVVIVFAVFAVGLAALALATACGGRTDFNDSPLDAGSHVDVVTEAPGTIEVGDAGLTCSPPQVSTSPSLDGCTITMTCSGGLVVDGQCNSSGCVVRCTVGGNQTANFTSLSRSDCSSPGAFASAAIDCNK